MPHNSNIVNTIVENMRFRTTYFAQYSEEIEILSNNCIIKCTNISDDTFNVVFNARFTKENANQKIDEIIETFQKKNLPFVWSVWPFRYSI